ncbi:hypothetical protein [Pseudogemmobacter faecipullorum]|uniref:Uncharacterized protein n=1 Tax=Pseudogemmobacter faecipullorum TaxID=2755041 RepID=A0ABS8CQZ4_9RHOB|nr:hypothetical protein [Pseudogemmobacter faecipullorum]MCB5411796.1 hypothetical protein [Pseudogemmobacter faecipullorum]
MGSELTLAQRLRVAAALNGEARLTLDRASALWLVRMMEREEAVIRAQDAVMSLRADHAAREERRDKILRRTMVDLLSLSASALALAWAIAGWL